MSEDVVAYCVNGSDEPEMVPDDGGLTLEEAKALLRQATTRMLHAKEAIALALLLDALARQDERCEAMCRAASQVREARRRGNMPSFWAAVGRIEGLA